LRRSEGCTTVPHRFSLDFQLVSSTVISPAKPFSRDDTKFLGHPLGLVE